MRTEVARRFLSLVLILGISFTAMPAFASEAHEAGIQAFKEGDYHRAVQYFRQAEAEGVQTPNLRYNLGVTNYRLGQYEQAEQEFLLLAENPQWRHLALYNLGLVAEAQENREAALDYYSRAVDAAEESATGGLAAQKLEELDPKEAAPILERGYAILSASVGYDDNVVLAPEDGFRDVNEEGDMFTELFGLSSVYVSGDRSEGIRLDADAFTLLYASETDYSFGSFAAGISRLKQHERWHTSLGARTTVELAEDGVYAVQPELSLKGERSLDEYRLELVNRLSWIEGGSDYDYLTGVRNRLRAQLKRSIPQGKAYTGKGFEYNNRDDLSVQEEFFSYSPLRIDIHAGVDYQLGHQWALLLYAQYRKSLYSEENRMELDDEILEEKREDDRLRFSLRGEYEFSSNLIGFAEWIHTDNDSNFSRYSYERNRFMCGIQQVF